MLWTIIPDEVIFSEDYTRHVIEVEFSGVTMEVEPQGFGRGQIVRIISSDPELYLNPAFQPGQVLDLLHLQKQE